MPPERHSATPMPTSRRSRLILGLVVVAAVAGLFFVMRSLSTGNPGVAVIHEPAPSASPTEPKEPKEPKPQFAQPKRFRVEIVSANGQPIDSTNMFGRKPQQNRKVVKKAAKFAGRSLQRYLNSVFVVPSTRFTGKPLKPLLTNNARKALRNKDRRALGAKGPKILGGKTVSAKARAAVVYEGNRPFAVTLRYAAKMNIIQTPAGKPQRMSQSGTMVFRQVGSSGWRADMIDVRLALPRRPKAGQQPSEGATP